MDGDPDDVSPTEIYLHSYLHLIGITILYYDYFLTFSQEVEYIWSKPKLLHSWPFLLNRYFSLLVDIVVNVGNFTPFKTVDSCKEYTLFRQLMIIAAQVVVCHILTMRTYALWGRDKRVWIAIICVSCVLIGLSAWSLVNQSSGISIHLGCHVALSKRSAIRIAVAWECLFVFDSMIFALTLYKSYKQVSSGRIGTLNDLVILIARDGAMYFAVMATANLANVFTFYFWTPALRGALSTFASSISVTMMSRVMLNLQEKAGHMRTPNETNRSTAESSTYVFTSRISMSMQFAHSFGTSLESSSSGSSTGRGAATRILLLGQSNMEPIDEVIELRELSSPSRESLYQKAPGLV